jgi:hypothetical protein
MSANWIFVVVFCFEMASGSYDNLRLVVDQQPWILSAKSPIGTVITRVEHDSIYHMTVNYKLEGPKENFKLPFQINVNGTVTLTASLEGRVSELDYRTRLLPKLSNFVLRFYL